MSIIYIECNLILAQAKLLLDRNQILIDDMSKGISPLVAAVILIAATMSIAGILSFWTTGFVRTKLGVAENETEEIRCLNAEFELYSSSLEGSTLFFVLENTRTYDLTLKELYLFDADDRLLDTKTLNMELKGNSLLAHNETIPTTSTRAVIKTGCPEVSVEFAVS